MYCKRNCRNLNQLSTNPQMNSLSLFCLLSVRHVMLLKPRRTTCMHKNIFLHIKHEHLNLDGQITSTKRSITFLMLYVASVSTTYIPDCTICIRCRKNMQIQYVVLQFWTDGIIRWQKVIFHISHSFFLKIFTSDFFFHYLRLFSVRFKYFSLIFCRRYSG